MLNDYADVGHLDIASLDVSSGVWRNGSASDSRSEGWELESLWPQRSERREGSRNVADSRGKEKGEQVGKATERVSRSRRGQGIV